MAQKKITELQLIGAVVDGLNIPSDNAIQSYRFTALQMKNYVFPDGAATLAKLASQVIDPNFALNYSLAASVATNALTIALKDAAGSDCSASSPAKFAFRSATLTTGTPVLRSVTGALSTVISSGSTAGHKSGKDNLLYIYLIDNAGTLELAWSTSGGRDEGKRHSTTAEGGAGAADSATVLYSTTARTNVAIRFIGRFVCNLTAAGTWDAAPTEISSRPCYPGLEENEVWYTKTITGQGSTNTSTVKIDTQKRYVGDAMTPAYSAEDGFSVTINRRGLYIIFATMGNSGGDIWGISRNSSDPVGTINSLPVAEVLGKTVTETSEAVYGHGITVPAWLEVGDIIRVQTEGAGSFGGTIVEENCQFRMVKAG